MDEIPAIRYDKGIVMIRENDLLKVKRLIKEFGADCTAWKVIPTSQEMRKLLLSS